MINLGFPTAKRQFEEVLAADERLVGWKGREVKKEWQGVIGEP